MILIDLDDYKEAPGTQYVAGAYYDSDEKEHVFTLIISYDPNNDYTTIDVEWVEKVPKNYEEVEADIKTEYEFLNK